MAGDRIVDSSRWFTEQSAGAPPALSARAAQYLAAQPAGSDPALALASAAREALAASLAYAGDRATSDRLLDQIREAAREMVLKPMALDLLAADALVTLALKARAVSDPAGLGGFAAELSHMGAERR